MKYCKDEFKGICLLSFASAWNMFLFQDLLLLQHAASLGGFQLLTQATQAGICTGKIFYDLENLDGYRSHNRTDFQSTEHTKQLWKWNAADQTHFSLLLLQGCMYFCDNANWNTIQSDGEKETQQTEHFPVHYCFRETCILVLITHNK